MASFYHAGDIGDLVYGLYVMRELGGGELFVGERTALGEFQPRAGISKAKCAWLAPLLNTQPWVKRVQWLAQPGFVEHDLNRFRLHWAGKLGTGRQSTLLDMHCAAFGLPKPRHEAWLEVPCKRVARVVFARSERQRNWRFPWRELVQRYGGEAVFVGLPHEWSEFCASFGKVRYWPVATAHELASVLKGADVFVGNSSAPLAFALAVGTKCVQEMSVETLEEAHTAFVRPSHVCWRAPDGVPEL